MAIIPIQSSIKFHKSVVEQVALLKSRGMVISDDQIATSTLSRVGYYRLSGYFYVLRKTNPVGTVGRQDDFQNGTSIELVRDIYEFDRHLRLLVLDAVERIEVAVRSDIAHRLGQRHRIAHEASAQLDGSFCNDIVPQTGKTAYQSWCERLQEVLKKAQKEDFVRHHNQSYGGKLPIWVVTEIWDFGLLSKFFAGMKFKDQQYIARKYGLNEPKYLISWLRAINFARNVSAHHSRLWNRNFIDRPSFAPAQPHHRLAHISKDNNAQTRIYGTLCVLRTMLTVISPESDWHTELKELCTKFPQSALLDLNSAGFPNGWETMSLWA